MQCTQQRTIKNEVVIKGIGLHSGEPVTLRLIPAESHEGIKFIKNGVYIPAHVENASGFDFSTTLEKDGQIVRTVEHLMAALYFTGIDNIYIEIQGEEIPILDGSAIEFIRHIKSAGIKILPEEKLFAVLKKEVIVKDGDKFIKGTPSDEFSATYHAQYNNSIIGNKKYTFSPSKELYENVAMARTYCFLEEVEMLQKMGLAKGGSLENAVVFDKDDVLNPEGLRFEDEPVKHKVLDLIGDLYLLGFPLIADVYSFKGGHRLNAQFVKKLIDEEAFEIKYFSELEGNKLRRAVA